MEFEFDPKKNLHNLAKHGISLEQAMQLWLCKSLIVDANDKNEKRYIIIGPLNEKLHSCVFTIRGNAIRLISARRSRKDEEKSHHEEVKKNN